MDYVSKTVQIQRAPQQIYDFFADFRKIGLLVPKDEVPDFKATENECSFSLDKLGKIRFSIEEKEAAKVVKYAAIPGKFPLPFKLWVQLVEAAPYDTRLQLTFRAELNFVMRNLLGKRFQIGLDEFAEHIARAFQ